MSMCNHSPLEKSSTGQSRSQSLYQPWARLIRIFYNIMKEILWHLKTYKKQLFDYEINVGVLAVKVLLVTSSSKRLV